MNATSTNPNKQSINMSLRLIVFGNNYKGQLGIGESKVVPTKPMTPREKEFAAVQRIPLPYSISKLGNPTIKKVATGSYFTFIVTSNYFKYVNTQQPTTRCFALVRTCLDN
jgi:hypothetical protein